MSRWNARDSRAERLLEAIGNMAARGVRAAHYADIADAEFRVFSQFGEDGIIQYLVGKVPIANDVFVEIGVENYREANTRFLLVHDNWRGVIVDAGDAHIRFIKSHSLGWRYDIQAVSSFVTAENINALIRGCGMDGDIGLMSLDIDGNDYWILRALEVVSPRIIVVEYNSLWGPDLAVSIPYNQSFKRFDAHHSGMYWGASIGAFARLMVERGYVLVGSNRTGNNAFFVREDVAGRIESTTPREAWRPCRIREARDPRGRLTYRSNKDEMLAAMRDLPLVDVASGATISIGDAYDLAAAPH